VFNFALNLADEITHTVKCQFNGYHICLNKITNISTSLLHVIAHKFSVIYSTWVPCKWWHCVSL